MKLQFLGSAAAEGWPAMFCECPACKEAARRGGRDLRLRAGSIAVSYTHLTLPTSFRV